MRRRTRRNLKKIGTRAGVVGGVIAAGFIASRLRRHHEMENAEQMNLRDAMRAQDFEPGGNFSSRRDIIGDPSSRASVGLAYPGEPVSL